MSQETPDQWFLQVAEDSVFGPVALSELCEWAADGRVAPNHKVSSDRVSWQDAPSLPQLGMNWTVTLDSGVVCGPMNLRALRDTIRDGTVALDAALRHVRSGKQQTVRDQLEVIFGAPAGELGRLRRELAARERADAEAGRRAGQADQRADQATAQLKKEQAASAAQTDALRQELASLRASLEEARDREQRIETLQREQQALSDQAADTDARLENTSLALAEAREALAQREAELGDAREAVSGAARESKQQGDRIAALDRQVGELTDEAAALKADLDARNSDLQRLQLDSAEVAAARATAENVAAALRSELAEARRTATETAAAHTRERKDLLTQVESATLALDAARGDVNALEQQILDLRQEALRVTEEHSAGEAELKMQLAAAQEANVTTSERLKAAREAAETRGEQLKQAESRIAELAPRLEQAEAEGERRRGEIDALQSRLNAQREEAEKAARQSHARVASLEAARSEARLAADQADQALRRQQEIFDVEQARWRTREKELDDQLAEQVKLLEDENAAWEARESNLQRKIAQLQKNCEETLAESAELRQQLEDARSRASGPTAAGVNPLVNLEAQAQAELKRWMKNR